MRFPARLNAAKQQTDEETPPADWPGALLFVVGLLGRGRSAVYLENMFLKKSPMLLKKFTMRCQNESFTLLP